MKTTHEQAPRRLSIDEASALRWILDAEDLPGRRELRAQVDSVQALSDPINPCDLRLFVSGLPPAAGADGHLKPSALVVGARGEAIGFIDLWVTNGYLPFMEYSWFVEMPTEYPSIDRLRQVDPKTGREPLRPRSGDIQER